MSKKITPGSTRFSLGFLGGQVGFPLFCFVFIKSRTNNLMIERGELIKI